MHIRPCSTNHAHILWECVPLTLLCVPIVCFFFWGGLGGGLGKRSNVYAQLSSIGFFFLILSYLHIYVGPFMGGKKGGGVVIHLNIILEQKGSFMIQCS